MSKRHPLDDAFQNKLREYSMPVPSEMWQNIESEMSRKKYPVWLPWIMGVTGIATLALVGYLLLTDDVNSKAKADNSPEPTADATRLQVIDSEDDTYNLSEELSDGNKAKDQTDESLTGEGNIYSREETHTVNSNELLEQSKENALRGSGSALSTDDKSNSDSEKKTKTHLGLANTDWTESGVVDKSSSLKSIDDEEYTQDENREKDKISSSAESEREGNENLTGERESSAFLRDAALAQVIKEPTLLNSMAATYYVHSDEESMGIPKLRKIRDRNCDDEQFSPGNIFLEFSYSLHRGNLKFKSTAEFFDSYANLRTNGEQFSISKQFQGLIAFQVGKRSYFKTGISINILESDYYFVDQVNKRIIRDSIWNDKTMEYEVTERETDIYIDGVNRYTFIDIPLLFSYGWQFNKIGMNLTTGPMVNISFSREGRLPNLIGQGIELQDGLWNDRDIYRKTAGLSWFLGTQISYQAYRNVDIYIEPRIISGLNSITLENDGAETEVSKVSYPLSQRIFQYGIGAGLRFSLNNK